MQITELGSDGHDVDHAAADNGNFASCLLRSIDDLLNAVNVGGEGRHDYTLLGFAENILQHDANILLRRREARLLRIRTVGHQGQNAALSDFSHAVQVRKLTIDWGMVEFEVTRMDNVAFRSLDAYADGIRNTVIRAEERYDERASELDFRIFVNQNALGLTKQIGFFQLILYKSKRELRTVYRNVQMLEHIRQASDMVFVTMRQHNASYLVAVLRQIGNIRNNDINAEHILFWELQSRIHDDNVVTVLDYVHVFSDLTDSAQCEDHQFIVVVFFGQMNLTLLN
ncbi:hypothetical protein D3C71_1223900 [compost metagenome]